jgi:hypothetical protein
VTFSRYVSHTRGTLHHLFTNWAKAMHLACRPLEKCGSSRPSGKKASPRRTLHCRRDSSHPSCWSYHLSLARKVFNSPTKTFFLCYLHAITLQSAETTRANNTILQSFCDYSLHSCSCYLTWLGESLFVARHAAPT